MPDVQRAQASPAVMAELEAGLGCDKAFISPKFLYDGLGSRLFESICELDEYYPTRTEQWIFSRHGAAMAQAVGPGCALVDLGAGNCAKAAGLFGLLHPAQYVPVDISGEFLADAVERLRLRFPDIEMTALPLDFSARLELPRTVHADRRLFFYPGSSIGNFTPDEALAFLGRVRAQCGPDGALLIGIDLVKDSALLNAAYDDALGVTAAFNLNVLRHLNRLMDADFDLRQWRHVAFYNEALRRVEMHLEARDDTRVCWAGGGRHFGRGERIHTEYSHKYRPADALALLGGAGFRATGVWTDDAGWFAVIHAVADRVQ